MGCLDGRRALIVGGGSGIGRAVVGAFLVNGAQVAVLERDPDKCATLRSELPDVLVTAGDASTKQSNQEAVSAAVTQFDGLDILVSCVGIFDYYRGIEDLDADLVDSAFDEMFTANVKSYVHSVKASLPHLRRSRGTILLTESTSAYYPGRGGVLYVSSKFAVRGLVIALAAELAPDVRVNGVAPGGTLGTDLRGLDAFGQHDRSLGDTPGRADDLRSRTPLATALTGDDHAGCYVFLSSEHARGITGGVLHSDGGIGIRT